MKSTPARLRASTKYRKANREKCLLCEQRYRRKLRADILAGYGSKCACCGETEEVFLTVDHINNDGAKHRRESGSLQIYREIRQQGYPPQYQLLCMNCNWARRFGECPHTKGKNEVRKISTETKLKDSISGELFNSIETTCSASQERLGVCS